MLEDIVAQRKVKLQNIIESGADPYPAKVNRDRKISDVLKKFFWLEKFKREVSICGRILSLRDQGNLIFASVKDESGRIQVILKKNNLENYKVLKQSLDIGDFLSATGGLIKTKTGEKSVEAKAANVIVKSILPLPSEWYGIEDTELKLRKRYLDIIMNPEVKELFIKKSIFWQTFRDCLRARDFLEVETPILESVPGGADAEPFVTHHNALNTDFYLRISLEISLKKLLVAGYEKVFEIGRIFRNEGIDAEHLQDYTQLEFYWAYSDYNDLMDLVENLYKKAIKNTIGSLKTEYHGEHINWGHNWKKVDYYEIFKEKTGLDLDIAKDEELIAKAKSSGIKMEGAENRGRVIDLLFKKFCRPNLIQPCFLINPPADIEPLAKRLRENPNKVARFQVLAAGTELGKGFSEANDPIDQRERFETQMKMREQGDKEAQRLDEDFIEALEYGMPPASGFGVSERLFAVLMDKPVRETVIFPPMKRENK